MRTYCTLRILCPGTLKPIDVDTEWRIKRARKLELIHTESVRQGIHIVENLLLCNRTSMPPVPIARLLRDFFGHIVGNIHAVEGALQHSIIVTQRNLEVFVSCNLDIVGVDSGLEHLDFWEGPVICQSVGRKGCEDFC